VQQGREGGGLTGGVCPVAPPEAQPLDASASPASNTDPTPIILYMNDTVHETADAAAEYSPDEGPIWLFRELT
jgi:hypothetical protein